MKKTTMDLVVGASILGALCILIAGVLWLKEYSLTEKRCAYTVLFPNVGALQAGNPVMVNGITKGRVELIYLRENRVAAVVHIDRDVRLTDSCRVVVQNIGLMGERGIGIQLGQQGAPVQPSRRNDTTFLQGYFDTGIAEAMGMMGTVLSQMETLLAAISNITAATVGDTAFIGLFHTLSRRLDTLTGETERLIARNGPAVDSSLRNLAEASSQMKTTLEKNSDRFSAIMANSERLSSDAITVVGKIDSLSASIQELVHGAQNGQGTIGMLLKDERFSADLRRAVEGIDSLSVQVKNHGLKVRLRLGFGK